MRRLEIEYSFTTEFGDIFRPSMRTAVISELYRNTTGTLKEVCLMKEGDFRRFAFATDEVMEKIKARMEAHGLRFGMTEEELTAYQDAEFLLEHPEENKTKDKKPATEQSDFDEIMCKLSPFAKVLRSGIRDVVLEHNIMVSMREAYLHQPWWVKMFCCKKSRYSRAVKDTFFMYGAITAVSNLITESDKKIIGAPDTKQENKKQ